MNGSERMKQWCWSVTCGLLVAASGSGVQAEDWPQWLGPQRDSVWRESGIIEEFPEDGPKVLWRQETGLGYSGPAVAGDRVYLFDYQLQDGDTTNNASTRNALTGKERILCLDATTGDVVWEYAYNCPYNISYPSGPRCTPTVHEGLVYTVGAEGDLTCLDARTGKKQWAKSLPKEYNVAEVPMWGFANHPLVDGNLLYCITGGEGSDVVAFDRKTGEEVWKNLTTSGAGYSPPTLITHGGVKQLIIWTADTLNSLKPETGEVYWSLPLKPAYEMAIMPPRLDGDLLYAAGHGDVGACFRLSVDAAGKPAAEMVWKGTGRTAVYPANSPPFVENNTIYGCDIRPGEFVAADLETGDRLWETTELITGERPAAHATAFIVKNGNRFVLFTEKGDLVFVRLTRNGFREVSRAKVIEPTGEAFGRPVVWTHPAYANKCAYIRNDKEIVCIDLAK